MFRKLRLRWKNAIAKYQANPADEIHEDDRSTTWQKQFSTVCSHDFHQRIPIVSGAAAAGEIHSAMVRRHASRLDDVHARLSDVAVWRIRLRTFVVVYQKRSAPGDDSCIPVGRSGPDAAYCP